MTQQDVTNKIETDCVKKAFRRAEMTSLPLDVEQAYITQDHTFEQYSQHTQSLLDEAAMCFAMRFAKKYELGQDEVMKSMMESPCLDSMSSTSP